MIVDQSKPFSDSNPEVGQTMAYPTSHHDFQYLCEIPENVARTWMSCVGLKVSEGQWDNKLAIVISVNNRGIFAVYYHDTRCWLVHKRV